MSELVGVCMSDGNCFPLSPPMTGSPSHPGPVNQVDEEGENMRRRDTNAIGLLHQAIKHEVYFRVFRSHYLFGGFL